MWVKNKDGKVRLGVLTDWQRSMGISSNKQAEYRTGWSIVASAEFINRLANVRNIL